jgi:hypothetical protein
MKFSNLDSLIKRCEDHLDGTNTRSTEIENCLVQYLLVRIWAEYEQRVSALVHRRCSRIADLHVKTFSQKHAKLKRFTIHDIGETLAKFGDDYKQMFHAGAMIGLAHVAWDNMYTNRQAVAHSTPIPMTFPELKKSYTDSLVVLDHLVSALTLSPTEIHDFK